MAKIISLKMENFTSNIDYAQSFFQNKMIWTILVHPLFTIFGQAACFGFCSPFFDSKVKRPVLDYVNELTSHYVKNQVYLGFEPRTCWLLYQNSTPTPWRGHNQGDWENKRMRPNWKHQYLCDVTCPLANRMGHLGLHLQKEQQCKRTVTCSDLRVRA